jgi:hypothetical protein
MKLKKLKLIAFSALALNSANSQKSNVAIIFIDDMGYAFPSYFGNPVVETPNIDALAREGLKFTSFYVISPICFPSRVAINTVTWPMRHKIHSFIASSKQNNNRAMSHYLNPEVPYFARILNQNGFATCHFGKWHMGGGRDLGDVSHPTKYGYDKSVVSFVGIGDRVVFPNDDLWEQSAKMGRGNIIRAEKHKSTEIYIDSALSFIDRNINQPLMWEYSNNPGKSIQPGKKAFRSPNLAIYGGDLKLLIKADSTDVTLYNLKKDPGENQDLADQKKGLAREMAWRHSMPVDILEGFQQFEYE